MPKKQVTDHLGNLYESIDDMCRAYGIPRSTYQNRLLRGWTIEQALTIKNDNLAPKVNHKKLWYDHLGNEYGSVPEMCRHYGITDKIFWSRKRLLKWPLEKILTTPVKDRHETSNAKSVTDPFGQEFPSISAMCRHHQVGLSTYRERRKMGFDMYEALFGEKKEVNMQKTECEDHLGNHYASLNEMCRHYDISRYQFSSRIKLGWTLEKALTEPYVINNSDCEDLLGNRFPTFKDMANFYALPPYALNGWNDLNISGKQELLERKLKSRFYNTKIEKMYIEKCISYPYFLVNDDGHRCILNIHTILDVYRNSESFIPILETKALRQPIRIIKRAEFPYFLAELNNNPAQIYSWWELIQIITGSNFGLKK